jgi:serine/threonine protein kinase
MALGNLIGNVLDGKYRIERQLGEGGMGAVYLATHLGTERPVALKVIAPQFMKHDEFVERFRREARAAGRLRHPNVVDVTDFGFARVADDQVAYLVMEYLDGCTLDEVLTEETSLPLTWVIDILEQACSAVGEAHLQGIIHRDLKPDNIWLEPNRRGGYTVKVLDFGIAKLDDPVVPNAADTNPKLRPHFDSSAPTQASEWQTLNLATSKTQPEVVPTQAADSIQSLRETELGLSEAGTQIMPAGADSSEAGTRILPPEEDSSEAGTQIYQTDADSSEAGTRILGAQIMEEAGTRILSDRITDEELGVHTASISSLTRVGSILGTPLYMSPEQCRGEALDPRADIYSLGVIGYRLLSGQTPFSGDVPSVMKAHRESPPPPLVVKRVPKKVAALIMAALSKDPNDRPASAEAFSSALRAHSDGTGPLLRRALTLYAEHLPTFLRLAIILYGPVVLFTVLQVSMNYMATNGIIPKPWGSIASAIASLMTFVVTFLSATVIVGVTTWLVTQALAMPLRPMLLRPAFQAMRKRIRPFILTTMVTSGMVFAGLFLCLLPGLYLMTRFAMVAPTVMMEDLRGRAAMRRSRALFRRSRRTVIAIIFIHIGVPILIGMTTSLLIAAVAKAVSSGSMKGLVHVVSMSQQIVSLPFTILLSSIASVVTALLYWKLRLAGGETLREAFKQFAEEEAPASKWQQKMRPGLTTPARTTR